MKEEQLKQVLQEIAEQKVPDTIDLWPELRLKLNSQMIASARRLNPVARRLGWAVVMVCAILLFISAAYALNPLIQNLLKMDPVLDTVISTGLGYPLNLTQTREGIVVTLEWAYADENRIVIAYTVRGNEADQYQPVSLALFDDTGTELPPFVGMGSTDLPEEVSPPYQGGYIFSFDASAVSNQSKDLDLHLEIVLESSHTRQSLRPFAFDFTIPFIYTSRTVVIEQTITVANATISLEKVTVTPLEVITVMCLDVLEPGYGGWTPISSIEVKSERAVATATVGQMNKDDAGCVSSRYFPSLYENHGSWTVTVTELVGFRDIPSIDLSSAPLYYVCPSDEYSEYCSEQLRIQGPWFFEFDLP